MNWLPARTYRYIASRVPILCVDGIIWGHEQQEAGDRYLLIRRRIPPFQGRWWVPGGRVRKGERLDKAFERIMRQELGLRMLDFCLVGVFEIHHRHMVGIPGGRHVVSVVFEAMLPEGATITLDAQHTAWKWATRLPRDFRVRESYGTLDR